jgi:hypothetical protein
MSIQLVSRARKAGLVITPRAVFQHQTVQRCRALWPGCADALPSSRDRHRSTAATPIMHWLLERWRPIDRFCQAMLLQVPAGLQRDHLVGALQSLLDHHDALRLRLTWIGARRGAWRWRRPARCCRRLPAPDRHLRA